MGKTLQVFQAFDRTRIAEIPMDDERSFEGKILSAKAVFQDRSKWLSIAERRKILQGAADDVESRKEELALLIAKEGGKPMNDALVEVVRAADGLRNAAEELRTFSGTGIPMGITPASEGRLAFTTKEPVGLVAAISAFNHPLNLIVHQVAPAIAVGCPVIVKPASATPLSCLELVKILVARGLPSAWCQTLVTDDNTLAERLATHENVAFMSFIGSAKVGWNLRSKLPPGARCALEHGGVAPAIVDASADLDSTIESLVKGGYYHAGQVCVSTQRIFVHKGVCADFVHRFSERVKKLKVGDPVSKETEVGPLISTKEVDRVLEWIEEAVSSGAKRYGGERLSETTLAPAVLLNPSEEAKVSRLEIFGPVTCVYEYEKIEEAIERANSLPFSFQASIFSSDLQTAIRCSELLEASTVLINDHTAFRTDWMPFAGRKHSGYGVGGIPYTMRDMTHEKMIVFKRD